MRAGPLLSITALIGIYIIYCHLHGLNRCSGVTGAQSENFPLWVIRCFIIVIAITFLFYLIYCALVKFLSVTIIIVWVCIIWKYWLIIQLWLFGIFILPLYVLLHVLLQHALWLSIATVLSCYNAVVGVHGPQLCYKWATVCSIMTFIRCIWTWNRGL